MHRIQEAGSSGAEAGFDHANVQNRGPGSPHGDIKGGRCWEARFLFSHTFNLGRGFWN